MRGVKEKMKKKKESIISIVAIVVLVLAIVGVSFAAFNYSRTGSTVNTITTGAISMTYTETDNVINIEGALPTTDATGMVRLKEGEYFDFSISSTIQGTVNINYEISAKDITVLEGDEQKIDGSHIKLYLTKVNGSEEETLMSPKTYKEETSANDYTGRPVGQMSLYQSNMTSSETNNYRLRMYVDEAYNPQGDGGGLVFAIQVNVYGKDGDKYVPLTTQEILEDNELQEETTNMFDYASNGDYISSFTAERPQYGNEPSQITAGLYSMEDEDGTSYYFRGNVENNNVQFGEYESDYYVYEGDYSTNYQSLESCQADNSSTCTPVKLASAGDKMYWKIVRINGDGSIRLIYNGTSASPTHADLANSYAIGEAPYNLSYNDPKYSGYTYDNGTDSFIKREVDTWYSNTLGSSSYDAYVTTGRFCSDSSGYQEASNYGLSTFIVPSGSYAFASMGERLVNFARGEAAVANVPTLICPETSESYGGSYRLKAGLITADELVLAGESYSVEGNSYLSIVTNGYMYWSMTPADFYDGDIASVWIENFFNLDVGPLDFLYAVRPVINVTTNNGFASGSGSVSDPYVIAD